MGVRCCYLALTGVGIYFARGNGDAWINVSNGFDTSNFLGGLPRAGYGFACGVLLHRLTRDSPASRRLGMIVGRTPFPSFALYAALLAIFLFPKSLRGLYPMLVLAAAAPAIVFIGAHIRTRQGTETNVARLLGWISYPIYCLHVPVVRLVIYMRGGLHSPAYQVMFVSATITIALAIALTKWYEEPLRAVLSGLRQSRRAAPSAAPD